MAVPVMVPPAITVSNTVTAAITGATAIHAGCIITDTTLVGPTTDSCTTTTGIMASGLGVS